MIETRRGREWSQTEHNWSGKKVSGDVNDNLSFLDGSSVTLFNLLSTLIKNPYFT
ncbi:hypothetical protein C2845_PM15G01330 [Panicum miliaceum]|uniref:Uncharacterized protein n=1 Tax=Panicum miliaceum TaxID=4540 RepID=A0A3L6Q705_PANMI|nr:hypothetical protein C2845_PM15G01330 [Panicum miliaceum]